MRPILAMLVTVLVVSACGKGQVEPAFTDYVVRFEKASVEQGHKVDVHTGIKAGKTVYDTSVAECGNGEIVVNIQLFNALPDSGRESVIFHELGHCELGRVHNIKIMQDPSFILVPESVMYPSRPAPSDYEANHDYYLKELFK